MKIDEQKIKAITIQYLSDANTDETYEYTETIVNIAELCGYKYADLWNEDGDMSELLKVIDSTLYSTATEMEIYDIFN